MARRDYKLSIVVSAGAGTFAVPLTQGSCLRVDALKVRAARGGCSHGVQRRTCTEAMTTHPRRTGAHPGGCGG